MDYFLYRAPFIIANVFQPVNRKPMPGLNSLKVQRKTRARHCPIDIIHRSFLFYLCMAK
jgi:hypothetical protein